MRVSHAHCMLGTRIVPYYTRISLLYYIPATIYRQKSQLSSAKRLLLGKGAEEPRYVTRQDVLHTYTMDKRDEGLTERLRMPLVDGCSC